MSEALRILVGESAPAIPASQLLLDDVFDILRKASVAESRQDTGRFGDELLHVVANVDPNRTFAPSYARSIQLASNTRLRSKSKRALPNICLLVPRRTSR